MPDIKIVFLDWHKTLSYSRFWEQLEDVSHPYFEYGHKVNQLLFCDDKTLLIPWMRGHISIDDALEKISQETSISQELLMTTLEESCRNMIFAYDDLVQMIQTIRKRNIKCVVATDNMDTFRKYTIPGMNLEDIFDDFLISCELGVLKFDVNKEKGTIPFFDSYLIKNNLRYDQVVLIDDHVDDGFYASKKFRIMHVNSVSDVRACLESLK